MAVNQGSEQLWSSGYDNGIVSDESLATSVGVTDSGNSQGGGAYNKRADKRKSARPSTNVKSNFDEEMAPLQLETRRRRVLLSTSTPFSETVVRSLFRDPDIDLHIIAQEDGAQDCAGMNVPFYEDVPSDEPRKTCSSARKWMNITSARLTDWADMLIVAPADSGTLGSMIAGLTSTLTLTVLRGWDISKTILVVPAMRLGEWKAPITRRQLDDIRTHWPWARILPPVISRFEPPNSLVEMAWDGREMFYEEIRKGLGWSYRGGELDTKRGALSNSPDQASNHCQNGSPVNEEDVNIGEQAGDRLQVTKDKPEKKNTLSHRDRDEPPLPPEILSLVFEQLGDWEIAMAVGVYTRIPIPQHWKQYYPNSNAPPSLLTLEYTILTKSFHEIKKKLSTIPRWMPLSNLAAHLILRFSRIDILDHLCTSQSDLYWATPRLSTLPYRASGVYGDTALLDWWLACPDVPSNDYLPDAIDSASRAGFVHVLDWWRNSGLPLRYTERALESASAEGQIDVLDWWTRVSDGSPDYDPVPLKIGKSVLLAAQCGRTASLAWWDKSGIAFSHAESVARIASTHGHVPVLDLWFQLKGSKIIFDNQVLVGATKNGHVDVLEWWRRSGLRVEFKTCDIEEALEDAVTGSEERVRQWWERNGLNLGVGTSEWMKVKVL